MNTVIKEPQTGDVYAFWIERMGQYGALQVTGFKDDDFYSRKTGKPLIATLLLNWTSKDIPNKNDLPKMKPFTQDYYSWNKAIVHKFDNEDIPADYIYIGNMPPLISIKNL